MYITLYVQHCAKKENHSDLYDAFYITPLPLPKVADVRGLAFICMHAEAPCLSPGLS